jgi:hypothetical protein
VSFACSSGCGRRLPRWGGCGTCGCRSR